MTCSQRDQPPDSPTRDASLASHRVRRRVRHVAAAAAAARRHREAALRYSYHNEGSSTQEVLVDERVVPASQQRLDGDRAVGQQHIEGVVALAVVVLGQAHRLIVRRVGHVYKHTRTRTSIDRGAWLVTGLLSVPRRGPAHVHRATRSTSSRTSLARATSSSMSDAPRVLLPLLVAAVARLATPPTDGSTSLSIPPWVSAMAIGTGACAAASERANGAASTSRPRHLPRARAPLTPRRLAPPRPPARRVLRTSRNCWQAPSRASVERRCRASGCATSTTSRAGSARSTARICCRTWSSCSTLAPLPAPPPVPITTAAPVSMAVAAAPAPAAARWAGRR